MRLSGFLAAAVCFALSACATTPQDAEPAPGAASPGDQPLVLMIGLDGLRWDAIDRHDAPTLRALAERGARAERMMPVTPSMTFTNFYSIATGLHPEDHGMITNSPYDRAFDEGFVNDTGPQEKRWWHGEPIWITAENQGLETSILFWLGSEVAHDGVRPTRWTPYDHDMPYEDRVEQVLGWYEDTPPDFAAVYFDAVDTNSHRFGPESAEEGEAIARVDAHIADLLAGIEAAGHGDRLNVVIVSDHGFVSVDPEDTVWVDDFIDLDTVYIPELEGRGGNGHRPYLMVYGEPGEIETAYDALDGASEHIEVYRRGETPDHIRIDHPDRGPDLFVLAEPGWTLASRDLPMPYPPYKGFHGYDGTHPLMGATFIAAGPQVREGVTVPAFTNVNVYLTLARMLGLDPAPTEGDRAVVDRILKD